MQREMFQSRTKNKQMSQKRQTIQITVGTYLLKNDLLTAILKQEHRNGCPPF